MFTVDQPGSNAGHSGSINLQEGDARGMSAGSQPAQSRTSNAFVVKGVPFGSGPGNRIHESPESMPNTAGSRPLVEGTSGHRGRDEYVDTCRGVACVLLVAYHAI